MAVQDVSSKRDRQHRYWRNQKLKAVVHNPLIALLSRRTPRTSAPSGATCQWTLSDRTAEDVLHVCNSSDLSLYILLVTMVKAVVARCTGEATVTVLAPSYSPDGVDAAGTVVVLQDLVRLSEDVRGNVLETRRTVVGAFSNQDVTLAELHGDELAAAIVRNNPFCVSSNIHSHATKPSSCPLEMRFTRNGRSISCTATYDSARLSTDLVVEFCDNFEQFTEAASSDYTVPLEAVDWLRGDRLERVAAYSKGPVVDASPTSVHALFAEQTRKTPNALALIHGSRSVTYDQLNAMADAGARRLTDLGVVHGDAVALRLNSGIETVATFLGVLKAGAAFTPISVNEPPNRLIRLLDRCHAKLLVTDLGGTSGAPAIPIVETSRLLEPAPEDGNSATVPSGGTAYIIFTSGTSGEPKAVVVEHRGIVNAIRWKIREYAFAAGHRVLPLFGYEFDGFILNVFAPLCAGATVVLVDDERRLPRRIADCIEDRSVTHLIAAPLLYKAVLEIVTGAQFRSVERVTLAGEAAEEDTIVCSKRVGPHIQISNEYGPTENSVISTYLRDLRPESVTVIGTPIDNVSVYILDSQRNPVPPGAIGELFVAGHGLAREYTGGGEVMRDAFIEWRGERLYQTGDLGRWLPDGNIEFRGRRERYVKMRGYRIDLEEVRRAILRRSDIRDAVVLHVGDPTDGFLVAWVVAPLHTALEGIEVFLHEELPPHMIPNRFILLEALPFSAGGKVDMAMLRAGLHDGPAVGGRRLPSNKIERRLVEIWRKVLETERVGVDDGFFELGGHSLRAVRLLTEIHDAFGVELRLRQIFNANTVRSLAAIISDRCNDPAAGFPSSENRSTASDYGVLSPAQERMLVLTQEHSISYNLPILFALTGDLDVARLRFALHAVVGRHDSLRASFHLVKDRRVQRFGKTLNVPIIERAIERECDIVDAAKRELTPFDLETAPLFRVVLFTAGDRPAFLLFDFHHIIVDEASLAIFFRELVMFYNGVCVERASSSYAAYAIAQQRRRASDDYQAQLHTAAETFRHGEPGPLHLSFDHPPPRRRTHRGGLVRRQLPSELVAASRSICAEYQVTDFILFMAVFSLLLYKYTHQSTMVIGAPVSVRSTTETRELVGLCLNTVAFKVVVPTGATFEEHLRGVAAAIIDHLGRSHVDFDDLVRVVGIERQFGENPFFNVMLSVVDASATKLAFDGIEATHLPLHNGTSKFDLSLELDLTEHASSFSLEYSTERFLDATIERLSDGIITLLKEVVARPAAPLAALQVLSPAEREQLLEWSGGARVGRYEEGLLSALFEQQVRERPSDVALVFDEDTLTYGALNTKANRLARKLRSFGCGEHEIVAVFCERSLAAIVAILAVQKAGAAHLPLDPLYPETRTTKMLSDSKARFLITDQDVSALHFSGAVINADADLSNFDSANLDVARQPDSLAYVLYTSGTTGSPNGVMIEQQNVVTLVQRVTSELAIDHRDVWTLFHSLCFDVSVWEMFGALLRGSRLVIVPRAVAADPERLLGLIEKNRVTVLCQPPSAFYMLADAMVRAERFNSLRYVILGGEAVKTGNLKSWYGHYGQMAKLINGYGITETTVYSSFKVLTGQEIRDRKGSIGRPLSGTYVYILGPDMSLCPVGVAGELYIGGLGVGRGYLGRTDLTKSRFIKDPFRPGQVIYRSGDLVRWLDNGDMEYLCRADTQVKVRGYRVELSEVETTMAEYSQIRESVVLIKTQGAITQLIGFFTSAVQEDLAQVRSHLERHLPGYMVPSRLVQIDRIPVTPNGKVDRAKLLSSRTLADPSPKRSATTALQELLRKTWANVLGISADEIGVDDSFFAIGGDSISANLVVAMLSGRGEQVELMDIFENQTLGALAKVISLKRYDESHAGAERTSYWNEFAFTKAAVILGPNEVNAVGTDGRHVVSVTVPFGGRLSVLTGAAGEIDLRDVLLTALGVSLLLWCGAGTYRVGLVQHACEDAGSPVRTSLVAPVLLAFKDIDLKRENLASVHDNIRRATMYRLTWNEVMADPAYRSALADGVTFHYVEVAGPDGALPVADGMAVECRLVKGAAELRFTVPELAVDADRLRFLAEVYESAFRGMLRTVPVTPTSLQSRQVSLDVQPFNDVFFKDCTHQAVVAAVGYFGRDVRALLVNTTAVCERNIGRSCGLRVYTRYFDRRALDEVLVDLGIAVHRSARSVDVCEDLLECLSQGSVGIVKLDCYFVKGQRELYKTKHGEHTVLVCGYDREQRLFEIIDNEAGRAVRFRRTTIGFDELRAAFEGYQAAFNPRGAEVSYLTVSEEPGHLQSRSDEALLRHEVIETLRLADGRHDEEQAALALLYNDFSSIAADETEFMNHLEQFMFTFGELLVAKRLQGYQLMHILAHRTLSEPVDGIIYRLENIHGLLTKSRVTCTYSDSQVKSILVRLDEARKLHLAYAEAFRRMPETR